MECRDVRRIDILEEKLRWQKRVLVGLVVAFCFNASPVMSTASKWFNQIFPSKVTSSNPLPGGSFDRPSFPDLSENRNEMMSKWAEGSSSEVQEGRLSKQAHAVGDVLQVSELQIVNEKGTVVALIGYDRAGDGAVLVFNKDGKAVSLLGVDGDGHGGLSILNASERFIAGVGSDGTDKANGLIEVGGESGSFAGFAVDNTGNAWMVTANRDGGIVSGLGADESGHGFLSIFNASGKVIAAVGADDTEKANGSMGVLGESGAFAGFGVDEAGDALMAVSNRDGKAVSLIGADEDGHGFLIVLDVGERILAGMGADASGAGALGISDGRFRAFVNENGDGVAETTTKDGSVRWSSEMTSGGGAPPSSGLLGDLDGDGDVDFTDFVTFAANFGKTSG